MFDFLFKRSASKPSVSQPVVVEQALTIMAQTAARRAEHVARAQATVGNPAAAVEFILQSEFADARLMAAEHVYSQPMLERVHQAMRNTDRRVTKLMQARLDLIRHNQAEQQKAQASLDTAQRLLHDEKLSPNQVAELDRQWQVIKASAQLAEQFSIIRAGLAQRLEAQVSLQRAVIDAVAELRRLPTAGLITQHMAQALERLAQEHAEHSAAAERGSLPKHLQSDFAQAHEEASVALRALARDQLALEAHQAALTQWQQDDFTTQNVAQLKRSWQGLPSMPENELAASLQQQFHAFVAAFPASSLPQPVCVVLPAEDKDAGLHFMAALDGMEAALQQGLLHLAFEHDKTLRDGKAIRLTPTQSERLAQVRAEFKHLADWARWGGNVSREELVKAAEELLVQELRVTELAKKVGSVRECWKSLDALSGAAPKALWERFDAACSNAYAPAAAHFRQLAEERHANAAKAQALLAETLAVADANQSDWKQIATTVQRLSQAWSRLGTIERKEKKQLDSDFGKALATASAPLVRQRQLEAVRREQLIVEVTLLNPNERDTVDMLRALQEKWQEQARVLPLERGVEQALWQRFRAACDEMFTKRKETVHAADHERRDHLKVKEALCIRLETAIFPESKERAALLAALLLETKHALHAIGPVPRAAEQAIARRYQSAVAALEEQACAIVQRASVAQTHALRDKLRLCQRLESAVARPGSDQADVDWLARWSTLPPLTSPYEHALQGRFAAARQALTEQRSACAALLESNRNALQEEVLRLEIVAGIDSGAEFARARLKMQVEVLQASLKSGQKPLMEDSQWLQLCTLPALADARTVSRIDVLLRRMGGAGI